MLLFRQGFYVKGDAYGDAKKFKEKYIFIFPPKHKASHCFCFESAVLQCQTTRHSVSSSLTVCRLKSNVELLLEWVTTRKTEHHYATYFSEFLTQRSDVSNSVRKRETSPLRCTRLPLLVWYGASKPPR